MSGYTAAERDAADPLGGLRELFVGDRTSLVYFDGNSLGRPLRVTADRYAEFVRRDWGTRLIRGWEPESTAGWFALPLTLGDQVGETVMGAAPGQTLIGDSTTVLLYKLIRAAVDAQLRRDSRRTEIVIDDDNFPTDRYLVEGIAAERGCTVVWLPVERDLGVSPERLAAVVGERTAAVVTSHVAYRSGFLADAGALTRVAHQAGALIVLDVSHSLGSVEISLDEWGVDIAVGCTYKYLNGGPGAPACAYVASRLHADLTQPIQGWMGHADSFSMGPEWLPADGMRRFLSGTPPIIGMLALQDMIALIGRVGMPAIRRKSVDLTSYAVELADELLAPLGARLATPRDPAARGGHVTVSHPSMRAVNAALWQSDVLPDYRDPDGLRIGLSPLSTSYAELARGMRQIAATLRTLTRQ
ncbi:MAG: kynureninase [Nocardioides sp.]